jgi:hypothetical protein
VARCRLGLVFVEEHFPVSRTRLGAVATVARFCHHCQCFVNGFQDNSAPNIKTVKSSSKSIQTQATSRSPPLEYREQESLSFSRLPLRINSDHHIIIKPPASPRLSLSFLARRRPHSAPGRLVHWLVYEPVQSCTAAEPCERVDLVARFGLAPAVRLPLAADFGLGAAAFG